MAKHMLGTITLARPRISLLSLTSSTSRNTDGNQLDSLHSIPHSPLMDHMAVNCVAEITLDVTIDLPCMQELLQGLLP